MNETTTTRANDLIDPLLAVWHVEIPIYLFLGGLMAGLMVLSGLWMLRRGDRTLSNALALVPWAGPVLLSVGMFFLWLDLEHPFNAFRFYLALRITSPMSWGSWILVAVYPASILLAWVMTPEQIRHRLLQRLSFVPGVKAANAWALRRVSTLAAWNVALGAALGIYTGVLLGTMAARPLWNSAVLGPLFLVSGLSTGVALMLLYRIGDGERVMLSRIDMGLIVTEILLLGLWLMGLATGTGPAREAVSVFFGGPYTAAFWTLVVALGLLAPLVGEWIELRHKVIPGRVTAVFVLVGGFALRWIIVYAGQYSSLVTDVAQR
jgi:formate-dependent nitrite reductase membrane component NrfD